MDRVQITVLSRNLVMFAYKSKVFVWIYSVISGTYTYVHVHLRLVFLKTTDLLNADTISDANASALFCIHSLSM